MAAASYTTDLTNISLADSTTNWTAIGTGAISVETDYFIQGAGCISKVGWTAATRGQIYNNGAGITIPTDGGIFAWITYNNPNLMDTEANGGMQIIVGSGTAAYRHWYVRGSDTHQYGGWGCYVCNPDAVTQDLTTGSPTGTKQYIGGMAKILGSGSLKGNPFGVDAMRYGRGDMRFTGGDLANGYATIAAAATYANDISRRWGLLYERDGAYFQQGLMSFGQDGTAVDFRDSNRTVFILNTKKVSANFNKWEVRNASSRVDLTNFTVTALGTVSKGGFEAVANADVNIDTCTFNDMGAFTFQSNSTVLASTFRRCGLVTLGGGTFDGCTFDKASGTTAVTGTVTQVALITNSEFFSDGTSHAVEITGTADNMTLTGVTFTGYAPDAGLGNTWTQRGSVLTAADAASIDYFGSSVALSSDGSVMAVGARLWEGSLDGQGGVYIYDWSGSAWVQRGSVLTASDAAVFDEFGTSVALSSDGSVMAVGAKAWDPGSGTNQGGVYIYDWSGSAWTQRGSVLAAADAAIDDQFGSSVALSSDGTVLVVGAQLWEGAATHQGGVYIYDWSGSAWTQRGSVLTASDADASDNFGSSVALSSGGATLAVGAKAWEGGLSGQGGVYIYDWSGSAWVQRGSVLAAADAAASDNFGSSVALSGSGMNLVVGVEFWEGAADAQGGVYTFDRTTVYTGNEAIYVNIASGTMSIAISGGTVPSIRTAGATVTVVAGAVTASLTVTSATGTPIQDAQVLVTAASGGPLPYLATVTIANSGTTATVTHTGHGLSTNDKVLIKGASHAQNRGVFTITVTGANTYTYTMTSAPGSDPTGTITSTFVVLSGVTNANGVISMSRVFSADQPVSGWARKSTSSPYYKTGPVNGTVDSATGATLSAPLIADE